MAAQTLVVPNFFPYWWKTKNLNEPSQVDVHLCIYIWMNLVRIVFKYSTNTLVTHFWCWKVVSLRENVSLRVWQWDFVTYLEWHMSPKIVSLQENLMQFFPKWHTFPPKHVSLRKKCISATVDIPWVTQFRAEKSVSLREISNGHV